MRKTGLFVFLLVLLVFININIYATEIYKSATEYDYPPFSVTDNGLADGFSVELLKAVADEVGIEVVFKVDEWAVIKSELENGQLDLLPLVGYSKERDEYFDFTIPYIVLRGNVFIRKGNESIRSINDLKGKTVIVMEGDNAHEYALKNNLSDNIMAVSTYVEAFELLANGTGDAVLAQSLVGEKIINEYKYSNVEAAIQYDDEGIARGKILLEGYEQKFCFAVKEGDSELLSKLNEGLALVSQNGTYDKLYKKWFPFLIENRLSTRDIVRIVFITALPLIFLGILLSYFSIKRQVKVKTQKLEKTATRNKILFDVSSLRYDDTKEKLDFILTEKIKLTESQFGYIYFYDEEKKEFTLNTWSGKVMEECSVMDPKTVYQLEKTGLWGDVVRFNKPIIVNDFEKDNPRKKGYPEGHVKLKKYMSIPVEIDGKIVAVVGLANKVDNYTQDDIYQVTVLMTSAWNAIERFKNAYQLEVEKNKYLSTLISIGDAVMVVDTDGNIEMVNKVAENLFGMNIENIIGLNYKEVFVLKSENNLFNVIDPVKRVFETHKSYTLEENVILMSRKKEEYFIEDTASPILNDKNQLIGVVVVFRDATQKIKQRRKVEYLSYHDELTGLYNRRFMEVQLEKNDNKNNIPISIIMADLNGLKVTNDAFGHAAGDKLIKDAANVISSHFRRRDVVSRWGGDEFVVLLPNTDFEETGHIVSRIKNEISKLNVQNSILSIAFGWDTKTDENHNIYEVLKSAEEHMYRVKMSESQSVLSFTVKTMINTLFEKSPREKAHSERVRQLSMKIAKNLGYNDTQVDEIGTLGLLHDIGKIIISGQILEKPTKLNESEWMEIKKHPSIGYRILSTMPELSSIADGVLHHHEKWDGSGYPNGIKGEKIPLEARIIAVADAYDAMTCSRPYRVKGLSVIEAISELKKNAGYQFDPKIVEIFIEKVLKENLNQDDLIS